MKTTYVSPAPYIALVHYGGRSSIVLESKVRTEKDGDSSKLGFRLLSITVQQMNVYLNTVNDCIDRPEIYHFK